MDGDFCSASYRKLKRKQPVAVIEHVFPQVATMFCRGHAPAGASPHDPGIPAEAGWGIPEPLVRKIFSEILPSTTL
jgi:hypothetical protein